ncbi:DUF2199 domain-containing protein [Streptomyces sediminimaris]|uniref:DUF2199 domain-containing protein n=1 Tax=Streptomyces sediminimaris TaxID=3383721 RepID=UPI003999CF74
MAIWRRKPRISGTEHLQPDVPPCSCCGGTLDVSDPRFNLSLPQPVAALGEAEYQQHVKVANDAIVVTGNLGAFARALLPIALDDGRTTTIGVWVSVERDVFDHIVRVGRGELDFDDMQFDGRLANELDPWGDKILGKPVSAGVDVPTHGRRSMPHIKSSPDALLTRVLTGRWAAADVLTGENAWALDYDPVAHRPKASVHRLSTEGRSADRLWPPHRF